MKMLVTAHNNMADNLHSFILILLFLLLEGIFSGGELALVACDENRIRNKAKSGSRSAKITFKLLEKPEWFLSTTLTGTNLCVITNTAIATSTFISLYGTATGEFLAIIIMVPLLLIMGEIIPKSFFQQHAESMVLKVSWFIWIVSWIFFPVVYVVSKISRSSLYVFSENKEVAHIPYITKSGLEYLLQRGGEKGDIMKSEKEMIRRIFDFSDATVEEIMVPLSNVTALSTDTVLADAARIVAEEGYSRIPVYHGQVFNIIGILHSFDLLEALYGSNSKSSMLAESLRIEQYLTKKPLYVPETKLASELLIDLQKMGEHMAVIVDEYGGAVGIITIEDILEEIVGEIDDEYHEDERLFYKKTGVGKYLFRAQTKIETLRELMPFDFPDGDYETLAGYLLHAMGKIPSKGETFRQGEFLFVIEKADMKSIKEVLIVLPPGIEITA